MKVFNRDDRVMTPGGAGTVVYHLMSDFVPGKVGCYAVMLDKTDPRSPFPRTMYPGKEVQELTNSTEGDV